MRPHLLRYRLERSQPRKRERLALKAEPLPKERELLEMSRPILWISCCVISDRVGLAVLA